MIGVRYFDLRLRFRRHVLGVVAAFAGLLTVLPLQREAGLRGVIEILPLQPGQRKLPSVMLHVTARAVRLVGRRRVCLRMKARARGDAPLNFHVTFQTLESKRASAQAVALATFRDPLQTLVSLGKRAGRNLSESQRAAPKQGNNTTERDVGYSAQTT